jgi:hypothetical protein
MILFQCNNVIILSLISFFLNYNQHVIDTRHFKIPQNHAELPNSSYKIYGYYFDAKEDEQCRKVVEGRTILYQN